jgi:hypothetical protein
MATTQTKLAHGDPFAATGLGERVKVYARLAEQAPVHRITLPDGEPAWLVTLHAGKSARRSVCQYSSKVQQRPNCLARSPSSRCVLTSATRLQTTTARSSGRRGRRFKSCHPDHCSALSERHPKIGARVASRLE